MKLPKFIKGKKDYTLDIGENRFPSFDVVRDGNKSILGLNVYFMPFDIVDNRVIKEPYLPTHVKFFGGLKDRIANFMVISSYEQYINSLYRSMTFPTADVLTFCKPSRDQSEARVPTDDDLEKLLGSDCVTKGIIKGLRGEKLGLDVRIYGADSHVYTDDVRIALQNILLNRHVMKQQTRETLDVKSELGEVLKNSGMPILIGAQAAQMMTYVLALGNPLYLLACAMLPSEYGVLLYPFMKNEAELAKADDSEMMMLDSMRVRDGKNAELKGVIDRLPQQFSETVEGPYTERYRQMINNCLSSGFNRGAIYYAIRLINAEETPQKSLNNKLFPPPLLLEGVLDGMSIFDTIKRWRKK